MSSAYANAQQFFLAVAASALLMSVIAAPATASPFVSWRMIHGVLKVPGVADGVGADSRLWTTINGSATVDLGSGTIQFNVLGLTLAEGDAIGTTGDVAQVFGFISCNLGGGAFTGVSTPGVPLSPDGMASFSGSLAIPGGCGGANTAFFITILSPPKTPPYIAFGASRFTH
jgi:hypothetical protein